MIFLLPFSFCKFFAYESTCIFTSITRLSLGHGNIVFGQSFRCRILIHFIVLRCPESKKLIFESFSVRMYVCEGKGRSLHGPGPGRRVVPVFCLVNERWFFKQSVPGNESWFFPVGRQKKNEFSGGLGRDGENDMSPTG